MTALDVRSLGDSMIDAARDAVTARWPAVRALAEVELRKLAQTLEDIRALLEAGEIDTAGAHQLLRMQQNSARGVLCMVEGLGLLTAEEAVSAAGRAVAAIVNGIVKFRLL